MAISGSLPEIGELSTTADPKIRALLSELKTVATELESVQHAVKWYEPKVIATEESKTSTSFVTMTTADEITGIVVPANGLVLVSYRAMLASSAGGLFSIAGLFFNGVQIGGSPGSGAAGALTRTALAGNQEASLWTLGGTLVTTGALLSPIWVGDLAPGTYSVSIRFKASSGSITAKERILRVGVLGV